MKPLGICLACCLFMMPSLLLATEAEPPDLRLQWFQEAKLGIFIHWGIYAVDGIGESWSFHNGHISHEDYMDQLSGFSADQYDPQTWADLIAESGARYAVLTAKHHDGVALWDSRVGPITTVKDTPAGRDLVGPFCQALRQKNLKVGLYYSLIDWSHQNYPNFLRDKKRYEDDEARWQLFSQFNHAQIKELSDEFQPDLVWFDGDWEFSAEVWRAKEIRQMLLNDNPQVIINSRLQGYGDYGTPEQGVPIQRPKDPVWELCLTMNDSWGYQPRDTNYKSANQIIRIFVDCLHLGGNLLLDIGPRADGTICPEQVAILKELGRWTRKHAEAIYGTESGLPAGYFHGPSAVSGDRQTLYLYLPHRPNGPIMLKGLKNEIRSIRVVGRPEPVTWDIKMKLSWREKPGIVFMNIPQKAVDKDVTVVAVELEGPLDLFQE